jgi:hypothetical protein
MTISQNRNVQSHASLREIDEDDEVEVEEGGTDSNQVVEDNSGE